MVLMKMEEMSMSKLVDRKNPQESEERYLFKVVKDLVPIIKTVVMVDPSKSLQVLLKERDLLTMVATFIWKEALRHLDMEAPYM